MNEGFYYERGIVIGLYIKMNGGSCRKTSRKGGLQNDKKMEVTALQ